MPMTYTRKCRPIIYSTSCRCTKMYRAETEAEAKAKIKMKIKGQCQYLQASALFELQRPRVGYATITTLSSEEEERKEISYIVTSTR